MAVATLNTELLVCEVHGIVSPTDFFFQFFDVIHSNALSGTSPDLSMNICDLGVDSSVCTRQSSGVVYTAGDVLGQT